MPAPKDPIKCAEWKEKLLEKWRNPEYRKHMSESHKGNPCYWQGKKRSEETKEKIRQKKYGQKHKNETKVKISKTLTGLKRPEDFGKQISERQIGKKNPSWSGNKVGRKGIHSWLMRNYGKADRCENREKQCLDFECTGNLNKRFHWANTNNHIYRRRREDFMMLCAKCHSKYDKRGFKKGSNKMN